MKIKEVGAKHFATPGMLRLGEGVGAPVSVEEACLDATMTGNQSEEVSEPYGLTWSRAGRELFNEALPASPWSRKPKHEL